MQGKDTISVTEYYDSLYGGDLDDDAVDYIKHYGIKYRSGRYPYGSGEDPYQHEESFLTRVSELEAQGLSMKQIAEVMGYRDEKGKVTTTPLKDQMSIAKSVQRSRLVARAESLKADGLTLKQIADEMGYKNDSSVRALLDTDAKYKMLQARSAADALKEKVDEKGMIMLGEGSEKSLNISKEKLRQALHILDVEGYPTYGGRMPQINSQNKTTIKVLCPPDTEHKEIFDFGKLNSLEEYISRDGGDTLEKKFHYPSSLDSDRLLIKTPKDGGALKDGIVELRRGVEDLSLGESRYSQVRIMVDDKLYIKGMAVYGDDKDFPPGKDIIFYSSKPDEWPMEKHLKEIKKDPDNPFGSAIKDALQGGQYWYEDKETGEKKLGLINKRADEGDWDDWKDKLPSQFLSKQPVALAKKQIKLAMDDKYEEYESISKINNPTVKKALLDSFAEDCDAAAEHLYAAALPRQKYHVIVPINTLKDKEIYAPKYNDGEEVVLIRYPHGGTFEIPRLTVNNKNKLGNQVLGKDVKDAVGINHNVAAQLSGADFDGDTVMVIPVNDKVKIKTRDPLEGLKGFDPRFEYGTNEKDDGFYNKYDAKIKTMEKGSVQQEMGKISNLITDMTIKGATDNELTKAVKHSMVVIDAYKHHLDYHQSAIDNDIALLKKKYQGHYTEDGRYSEAASTIISRSKGQATTAKRQGEGKVNIKGTDHYDPTRPEGAMLYKTADDLYKVDRKIDKKAGIVTIMKEGGGSVKYRTDDPESHEKYKAVKKVDPDTGDTYYSNPDGSIRYKTKMRTEKSTQMAETDDAHTLVSSVDSKMEILYADYANNLKALANKSRKDSYMTKEIEYNPNAKKVYQNEFDSLNAKLNDAEKNKPRERQAQAIANGVMKVVKEDNPDMTKDEIKKRGQKELTKAREIVGAKRTPIEITNKEWEAIQAGAISKTKLKKILNSADMDVVRKLATPRETKQMTNAQINRMKTMIANGKSAAQVAKQMGISASTVLKYTNGKEK